MACSRRTWSSPHHANHLVLRWRSEPGQFEYLYNYLMWPDCFPMPVHPLNWHLDSVAAAVVAAVSAAVA